MGAPVRSLLLHGNARYVTYTYTAEKAGAKPHAQVPVAGRRSGSVPFVDYQKGAEAHRVAQVPDKLNRAMKLLRPGQIGYNLEVVSGQFEFVWDEATDTLTLVNASRIVCQKAPRRADEEGPQQIEENLFYDEAEFARTMKLEEERYKDLTNRFPKPATKAGEGEPANDQTGGCNRPMLLEAASAADRLAGRKAPTELSVYYQAQEKMTKLRDDHVKAEQVEVRSRRDDKGAGLGIWFKRWKTAIACEKEQGASRRPPALPSRKPRRFC